MTRQESEQNTYAHVSARDVRLYLNIFGFTFQVLLFITVHTGDVQYLNPVTNFPNVIVFDDGKRKEKMWELITKNRIYVSLCEIE